MTDLKCQTLDDANAVVAFVRGGGLPALVQTAGNVFPMNLNGLTLVVKISTDGGATYPTTRTHTFTGLDPFNDIATVVAEIVADAVFMSTDLVVYAVGNELVVRTKVAGNKALKVDAASTGIGAAVLQFLANQVGNGSVTTVISVVQDNSGKFVLFFT